MDHLRGPKEECGLEETLVKGLRDDPAFASECLEVAMEGSD
ncbi:MAG: hypothetical protein AB7O52_15245 [Planctomycetota bacterium]